MLFVPALVLGLLVAGTALAPEAPPPSVQPDRVVVISGPMSESLAPLGTKLLAWARADPSRPVDVVLDSPGGGVVVGFRFISQMEAVRATGTRIRCFVPTIAASMAFQVFVHCDERYVLDHAFLLWHRVRVSVGDTPITAPAAEALRYDLEALDRVVLAELDAALAPLDPAVVAFHFERETLHQGTDLAALAPEFCTSLRSVPGLFEALASAPRNTQPASPFGDELGEIVYQAPASRVGGQ
jgi:hypothetical protein